MCDTLAELRRRERQLMRLILVCVSSTAVSLGLLAAALLVIAPWLELRENGRHLAAAAAHEIFHLAAAQLDHWQQDALPIAEILDRLGDGAMMRWRVVTPERRLLLAHGNALPWPSTALTAEIGKGLAPLGQVELELSFRDFALRATLVTLCAAAVAAASFRIMRRKAQQTLAIAIGSIVTARAALERRIAELHETRRTLATTELDLATALKASSTASARALEADRAKARFLATMNHELRTPLNAIIGFSEIIREQTFGPINPPRYHDYANDISVAGHHLLRVIVDILELARIETGHNEIVASAIDPGAAVEESAGLVRDIAAARGLMLAIDIDGSTPRLWADPQAVRQILIHLLSNAAKFTPRGGRITLRAAATPEGRIALAVADTGIGIPAAEIARLVQPFEHGDHRYSRSTGGSGLGLAIVKGLTELQGGTLSIDSEVGRGTTVTVELPSCPAPAIFACRYTTSAALSDGCGLECLEPAIG